MLLHSIRAVVNRIRLGYRLTTKQSLIHRILCVTETSWKEPHVSASAIEISLETRTQRDLHYPVRVSHPWLQLLNMSCDLDVVIRYSFNFSLWEIAGDNADHHAL